MRQHHVHPAGLPAPKGYSHAVAYAGSTVIISGQVALDAEGNVVGRDDARVQTRQVFRNVERALAAAGCEFSDVVKLTIFLTDRGDLAAFREVRDEFTDPGSPPASSAVIVAGLIHPDLLVEVEATAVHP
jgi:reactive intermediate/imine deaminase